MVVSEATSILGVTGRANRVRNASQRRARKYQNEKSAACAPSGWARRRWGATQQLGHHGSSESGRGVDERGVEQEYNTMRTAQVSSGPGRDGHGEKTATNGDERHRAQSQRPSLEDRK